MALGMGEPTPEEDESLGQPVTDDQIKFLGQQIFEMLQGGYPVVEAGTGIDYALGGWNARSSDGTDVRLLRERAQVEARADVALPMSFQIQTIGRIGEWRCSQHVGVAYNPEGFSYAVAMRQPAADVALSTHDEVAPPFTIDTDASGEYTRPRLNPLFAQVFMGINPTDLPVAEMLQVRTLTRGEADDLALVLLRPLIVPEQIEP